MKVCMGRQRGLLLRDRAMLQGSLTIEAAVIVPMLLMVFALAMNSGLVMYEECRETAVAIMEEPEADTVKLFYRWKEAGELLGSGGDGE